MHIRFCRDMYGRITRAIDGWDCVTIHACYQHGKWQATPGLRLTAPRSK